ncbi:MAG: DUF362 domain-containing protein [Candidatus Hydrogenedentes bacterium]|nr:DUF362 domain-containing protein [Candidatus Hydrogenedentota bacterium]
MTNHQLSRRHFLNLTAAGILGSFALTRNLRAEQTTSVRLALAHGDSRADNVYQGLKRIEPEVRAALASKKRILIKPNMVVVDQQLSATHAECMEGILEFFSGLTKDEITVAETPANGPAMTGYDNYGYLRLKDKYNVKFLDLDEQAFDVEYLTNERYRPQRVRFSTFLAEPDVFLVSTAPMKTHDRAVVTLGLKNIVVGSLLKDAGYTWGPDSKGTSDKHIVHGGRDNQGIHFNMFKLARRVAPHLSVLDGFEGVEGDGPVNGTPVDHKVAVASTDWLAADSTAARLMGFDYNKVGYMVFAEQAGMGQADPGKIEVLGPAVAELMRQYKPHQKVQDQYKWMD